MGELVALEKWLSLKELGVQLGFSTRWLKYRFAEGEADGDAAPCAEFAGRGERARRRYRQSEIEGWLEKRGHLKRRAA